jgi:hypothetical protein
VDGRDDGDDGDEDRRLVNLRTRRVAKVMMVPRCDNIRHIPQPSQSCFDQAITERAKHPRSTPLGPVYGMRHNQDFESSHRLSMFEK